MPRIFDNIEAGLLPALRETLWAYARDDRPWGGDAPPGVAFVYAGDRAASSPAQHLAGYRGVLQTDGYSAYKALAKGGSVELAFCWTHTRRYFHKLLDEKNPAKTPIAAEAIARIQQLYAVEDEIRGQCADQRRAVRQAKSAPILADLKAWLSARLELISQKSDLAKAIRYALTHWDGLIRFLDDGRIELDNNIVERSIRPLALSRKNSLFAGSDGGADHWAILASLIETAKLNEIDPQGYIQHHQPHRRWPPAEPDRPAHGLELPPLTFRGFRTTLTMRSSCLAKWWPRHRCGPDPNAMFLGVRWMSNFRGST